MFLAVYETRRVQFEDGAFYITRLPDGYRAAFNIYGDEKRGFGDTPLAAIADYNRVVVEND